MSLTPGAPIRKARERAGLTRAELARQARTSPSAIARYESGQSSPKIESVRRCVDAGGFDLRVEPADASPQRQAAADAAFTRIAVIAQAHGTSVVTGDRKHYERIEGLRIEDRMRGWTDGRRATRIPLCSGAVMQTREVKALHMACAWACGNGVVPGRDHPPDP